MELYKYVRLEENALLKWTYDNSNYVQEGYSIITNLKENIKNFVSTTNLNSINNNLFMVDPVLKKYSIIDPIKFNFLQKQDYYNPALPYDKIKIYFPDNFNFSGYVGFYIKIYSLNYDNKSVYNISNFFYNKTQASIGELLDVDPFSYGDKIWAKSLEFAVPSLDLVSKQRYIPSGSTSGGSVPLPNTININLNADGVSETSPIIIDFSYIMADEITLGTKYFYLSDTLTFSLQKTPEYQTLSVGIEESSQGDYFEIYGMYNGLRENLDDFVRDQENKGRRINIEYIVTLYEENIQTNQTTFLISKDYSNKVLYRPIITFSNTTAAIDVEMKVLDLVDGSSTSKYTSIGLTKNLLKYGRNLTRINLDNTYKPKIYNAKPEQVSSSNLPQRERQILNITKVFYPVIVDRQKILVGTSTGNAPTQYKSNGLLNIVITPFDSYMRFSIAKDINNDGSITPYNLAELLQSDQYTNNTLTLVFRSDSDMIEKDIFKESGDNNLSIGNVIYKIEENDVQSIKKIAKNNQNFYLILKTSQSNTLFYSGKFNLYENVRFLDSTQPLIFTGATTPILTGLTLQLGNLNNTIATINNKKFNVLITRKTPLSLINATEDVDGSVINTSEKIVNLQTWTGKYVSADESLNGDLYCNRDDASTWETFNMIMINSTTVAFKTSTGKIVTADLGDFGFLKGTKDKVLGWEKFTMETDTTTGKVAFKSQANNLYVSALLETNTYRLKAVGTAASTWEWFTLIVKEDVPTTFSNYMKNNYNVYLEMNNIMILTGLKLADIISLKANPQIDTLKILDFSKEQQ